jgi:hypothetical protein
MRIGAVRAANCYLVVDGMIDGGSRQVMGVPTKPATAGRVVCKAFFDALAFTKLTPQKWVESGVAPSVPKCSSPGHEWQRRCSG